MAEFPFKTYPTNTVDENTKGSTSLSTTEQVVPTVKTGTQAPGARRIPIGAPSPKNASNLTTLLKSDNTSISDTFLTSEQESHEKIEIPVSTVSNPFTAHESGNSQNTISISPQIHIISPQTDDQTHPSAIQYIPLNTTQNSSLVSGINEPSDTQIRTDPSTPKETRRKSSKRKSDLRGSLSGESPSPKDKSTREDPASFSDAISFSHTQRPKTITGETIKHLNQSSPHIGTTTLSTTSPLLHKSDDTILKRALFASSPRLFEEKKVFPIAQTRALLESSKSSSIDPTTKRKIDRSDWIMKVLRANPELANLRERLQPLPRAVSFCETYTQGRGRTPLSNEAILQLVMQYLDHEGLRGVLRTLERETDVPFEHRASQENQLQDSRLITLLMIALNDVEQIWSFAMGDHTSNRIVDENLENSTDQDIKKSDTPQKISTASNGSATWKDAAINLETLEEVLTALHLRSEDHIDLNGSSDHPSPNQPDQTPHIIVSKGNTKKDTRVIDKSQDGGIQYPGYYSLYDNGDYNIWDDPEPDSENLILEPSGGVLRASLNRLIELLTPADNIDLNFLNTFLYTYQLFCMSNVFFKKLVQRFNIPPDQELTEEENRQRALPVQIRVVNVLKRWIEEFYSDFDYGLIANIRDFCQFQVKETLPKLATSVLSLLEKQVGPNGETTVFSRVIEFNFSEEPPKSIIPKNIFHPSLSWEDVDDEELARQFTLIEFEFFYKIKASELLHQSWNKPKLKHRAPHVLDMIQHFNTVSAWVSTQIVLATKIRQRALIYSKLVGIAEHLQKLRNWNTLMAFIAAFDSAAIGRLKHTVAEMPSKSQNALQDVLRLMSSDDGYLNYRVALERSEPPCIPYMGLYFLELVHAEDGSENIIDGLINFAKCRLIGSIISHIKNYQCKGYNLQSIYQIQVLLRNINPINPKEIWSQSLNLEPRGAQRSQIM